MDCVAGLSEVEVICPDVDMDASCSMFSDQPSIEGGAVNATVLPEALCVETVGC